MYIYIHTCLWLIHVVVQQKPIEHCGETTPLVKKKMKRWYIYIRKYYSAIKRNAVVSFAEMWIDLEIVIQSDVSQKEKNVA